MVLRAPFLISLLLIILLGCSDRNSCNSKQNHWIAEGDLKIENGFAKNAEIPFSGIAYELSPALDTLRMISYKNGKKCGVEKKWYSNGQIKELRYYENGKKQGIHKGWWADGKNRFEWDQ